MRPHLAVRLLERDSLAQARDGVRIAAAAHRAQLLQRLAVWNQEIGFLADDREAGRHHADHGPGPVIGRRSSWRARPRRPPRRRCQNSWLSTMTALLPPRSSSVV